MRTSKTGVQLQNVFEVKRGFFLKKRTFVYLCLEMRFFCGWLMGFLPYVATKCTANKKKTTQKVFLYQVQRDTLFYNGTAAKKATRTSSADFRAHRRCLLILPRHDQGRSNLCVVRLEIPNRSIKKRKDKITFHMQTNQKKKNE